VGTRGGSRDRKRRYLYVRLEWVRGRGGGGTHNRLEGEGGREGGNIRSRLCCKTVGREIRKQVKRVCETVREWAVCD